MTNDRHKQLIERLLAEAEEAVVAGRWDVVAARCRSVLTLDPSNTDAAALNDAARRSGLGGAELTPSPPAPATVALPERVCETCGHTISAHALACDRCGAVVSARSSPAELRTSDPRNAPTTRVARVSPRQLEAPAFASYVSARTSSGNDNTGNGFCVASVICGVLAFFFFPIVFGPIGLILAAVGATRRESLTPVAFTVSALGMIIGVFAGAIVWSSMLG